MFRISCLLNTKSFSTPYAKLIRLPLVKAIMITCHFAVMCISILGYLLLNSYIITEENTGFFNKNIYISCNMKKMFVFLADKLYKRID